MFDRLLRIAVVGLALAGASAAMAAPNPVVQQKIGYVDLEEIQFNAQPVKEQIAAAEKKFGPKFAEAEKNMKRQEDLQREAKNAAVLAPKRQEEIRQELDELKRKLNDLDFQITNQMQKELDETTAKVSDLILRAIKGIADQNGFTLVLTKSSIVYGSPSIDLTPSVIKYLNGVKAPAEKPKEAKPAQ